MQNSSWSQYFTVYTSFNQSTCTGARLFEKKNCRHLINVLYLTQSSNKYIVCFYFKTKIEHYLSVLHFHFKNKSKARLSIYIVYVCLIWSCSFSIHSCKSESVKLSPEATLKGTNGQNICTGWASACIKHQEK